MASPLSKTVWWREYSWRSALTLSTGVFNGDGQISRSIVIDVMTATRLAVRPIPYLTIAANYARSGGDSARYSGDAAMEFRGRFCDSSIWV